MRVWIVMRHVHYEGSDVVSVFSTLDAAMVVAKDVGIGQGSDVYASVEEHEVDGEYIGSVTVGWPK